jgi:hypothetical protein
VSNGTKRFYVYAIMVDGVVKYIGKGTGPRARFHRWFAANKDPEFQAKQRAGVQAYWSKKREERGHE